MNKKADAHEEKQQNEQDQHENQQNAEQQNEEAVNEAERYISDLEEEKKRLEEELEELNDKYLRLMSEFENFRNRTQKEKSALLKNASEDILTGVIPVFDDLERALNAIKDDSSGDALEGVQLIYEKFKKFLKEKGVNEISAKGEKFDPEYHEALSKMEAPSKKQKGLVIDVVQKGYMLNDKIIRHAKVIVGA